MCVAGLQPKGWSVGYPAGVGMGALRPARPEPLGQHTQCAPGGMEEGVVGFSPAREIEISDCSF